MSNGTKVKIADKSYRCVGKWCGDWVFAPEDINDNRVFIYCDEDVIEMMADKVLELVKES